MITIADVEADGDVDVSAGGLILGFLLGLLIYVIADYAVKNGNAPPWVRFAAGVVAIAVFVLLGFDFNETS